MSQSYYSYTLKAKLVIEGDEADGYTATLREDEHPEIADIFGYGPSPSDAAHDLAATLLDAESHLADVGDALAERLQRQLTALRAFNAALREAGHDDA